jgi:hypothetical protein
MRRKMPSTAALTAFESAARHQSFTLAADELALTQSAVGRQIANLEELLGVKLFRRSTHHLADDQRIADVRWSSVPSNSRPWAGHELPGTSRAGGGGPARTAVWQKHPPGC